LMPTARMSVLLPDMLEPLMRRTRYSPQILTFGEGIGGMLVGVGGEGEERFDFADGGEPGADGSSVSAAPGLGYVGDLDTVEEWDVKGA
jgi:hypothetical protein